MPDNPGEELRDALASIQALIDQAEAHLENNLNLFSPEQIISIRTQIAARKVRLRFTKELIDSVFPR